jgi:hypothetical protein
MPDAEDEREPGLDVVASRRPGAHGHWLAEFGGRALIARLGELFSSLRPGPVTVRATCARERAGWHVGQPWVVPGLRAGTASGGAESAVFGGDRCGRRAGVGRVIAAAPGGADTLSTDLGGPQPACRTYH